MPTEEQAKRQQIIKEVYVGIIGWAWMVAALASVYFLLVAIFHGASWWWFLGCAAAAWLLYRVALYYQLERNRVVLEAAKNWPPKRPPELTPATYRVVYSDGASQETLLTPEEINRWATASNRDAEGKFPHRIIRVVNERGVVVWP
jgi:hypothetical protein